MPSLFFTTSKLSDSDHHLSSPSFSTASFSESLMIQTLEKSEPVIAKWQENSYKNIHGETKNLIKHVKEIHKAMQSLVSEDSNSKFLLTAHKLMQLAMHLLQKEFREILSTNQFADHHAFENADSVDVSNLKLIADCMISCGYGKECVNIYVTTRKSFLDEGIHKLGVDNKSSSKKIRKMDWEALNLKIKNWLIAINFAINTLFKGERILSYRVFGNSNSISESCFNFITKEAGTTLFRFPESVVMNKKKSAEKIFRTLDMYSAIANHWPEIESLFSNEPTHAIVNQAISSMIKLAKSVRSALSEFEASIHKDSSKSSIGVYQKTTEVMSFLSLLADYNVLGDILLASPSSSSPESNSGELSDSDESQAGSTVSLRFSKLIMVLLYKVERRAEKYKEFSFSSLCLSNNLNYVVSKIRTSNLKYILGDGWISKLEAKINLFPANYEWL